MKEVARLSQAITDSVANPAEVQRLGGMLAVVNQESASLQAEFQKNYGPRAASAGEAVRGTTLPNDPAIQSVAQVLPTDRIDQMLNGSNRAAELNLNPSAATFQPATRSLPGSVVITDPVNVTSAAGIQLMTTQQYEATLNPQYVANCSGKKRRCRKRLIGCKRSKPVHSKCHMGQRKLLE